LKATICNKSPLKVGQVQIWLPITGSGYNNCGTVLYAEFTLVIPMKN